MACLVAASIYFAATVDKADKSISAVASPDGKYKAVRLTVSGDRPAPFCVDTISIFLSVYPDSFAASESNYEVYAAPCAAPAKRKDCRRSNGCRTTRCRSLMRPARINPSRA